jgi:hypothetical protein
MTPSTAVTATTRSTAASGTTRCTTIVGAETYQVYTAGQATLLVDTAMTAAV